MGEEHQLMERIGNYCFGLYRGVSELASTATATAVAKGVGKAVL